MISSIFSMEESGCQRRQVIYLRLPSEEVSNPASELRCVHVCACYLDMCVSKDIRQVWEQKERLSLASSLLHFSLEGHGVVRGP